MSRLFYHVMQDNAGNLLFDVSGTMRLAGSGTLATIYGDEALTVILPNPMTNHPSFGSFKCFLGVGDYDFYMAKSGYTFETLTGVQGHGTMAQQNATSVAITGGSINAATVRGTSLGVGAAAPATAAHSYLSGATGVQAVPDNSVSLRISHNKITQNAIAINTIGADTGLATIQFLNISGGGVGSINATAAAVSYNTSSDARLKHAVVPLTEALAVIRALKPISFRWRANDSLGVGFLAHEVAEVVDGVVSGEPDAEDEDGNIIPQQIDPSKLVVWLVGACKDLAAQVEALTARLEAAGA